MPRARSRLKWRHPFGLSRREVVHEFVWLLVIVAAAALLQEAGILHPIERFIIDLFAATEPTARANYTAIIDIDDASFLASEGFDGKRPLSPNSLARLIIQAGLGDARVILVDVDTDVAKVRKEMDDLTRANPKVKMPTVPIVWSAATRPCEQTHCVIATAPLSSMPEPPQGWVAGLTTLIHDGDDVLRRYKQAFETAAERPGGGCECSGELVPTLSRVAAAAYQPALPPLKLHDGEPEVLLLNWRADRWFTKRFTALEVLRGFNQGWWPKAAEPMKGKIVLIGGTFKDSRDARRTPAGEMAGVEVLAHIVESELAGGGMARFHEKVGVLIDFVVGLALMVANLVFPSATRRRLAANAVMVLALPLVASWAMYRFSLYWASLAPVTAGVFLHQWHQRNSVTSAGKGTSAHHGVH